MNDLRSSSAAPAAGWTTRARERFCVALVAAVLTASTASTAPARAVAEEGDEILSTSWRLRPLEVVLPEEGDAIPLTLEDAIVIALRQNLSLQVQRFTRAQSVFQIQREEGIYDFNLGATGFVVDETSAAATALDGALISKSKRYGFNFDLSQLLPTGGTVGLRWNNNRFETNSLFASVNPSYGIDFDMVYNQPLLQGFGKKATERNLIIARTNSTIAYHDLQQAVIDLIIQVEAAYWSLVEARAQLGVAEESMRLAIELHDMNKVQVEVGTLAPLELVQSEAGIANRQEAIIMQGAAVEQALDDLRFLLNLDLGEYWDTPLTPTTDPLIDRIDIDLDAAIATAFDLRPELEIRRLQNQNLELDTVVAKNFMRPRLDLDLRYGYNGLGGTVQAELPEDVLDGGWGDAWNQIWDREFPGWQAALNFSYPIQNRAARANRTISLLALEQGETMLDEMHLSVRTDVRRAARNVNTAAEQIDSAQTSRRLEEENVEAERKRYENGLSTSFQVLQIQEDLTEAASREVTAITNYRRALAGYYRSIGRLLDVNDILLEDETDREDLRVEEGYEEGDDVYTAGADDDR